MFGMMFKNAYRKPSRQPAPQMSHFRKPCWPYSFWAYSNFFGMLDIFFYVFYDFQSFSFDKISKKIAYLPNLKNIETFWDTIPFFALVL